MPPGYKNNALVNFYRPCWNAYERGPPGREREGPKRRKIIYEPIHRKRNPSVILSFKYPFFFTTEILLLMPYDSNTEFVGEGQRFGLVDDDGFAFFDDDAFGAVFL